MGDDFRKFGFEGGHDPDPIGLIGRIFIIKPLMILLNINGFGDPCACFMRSASEDDGGGAEDAAGYFRSRFLDAAPGIFGDFGDTEKIGS